MAGLVLSLSWPGSSRPSRQGKQHRAHLSGMPGTRPGMTAERLPQALIPLRLEPDENLSAAEFQHRPLDDRRLRQHQRDRLFLGQAFLVFLGQLAERGAGLVEQALPADFLGPAFEFAALDTGGLVVIEGVRNAALVEPRARLLHRVAVLDAVGGEGPECYLLH